MSKNYSFVDMREHFFGFWADIIILLNRQLEIPNWIKSIMFWVDLKKKKTQEQDKGHHVASVADHGPILVTFYNYWNKILA